MNSTELTTLVTAAVTVGFFIGSVATWFWCLAFNRPPLGRYTLSDGDFARLVKGKAVQLEDDVQVILADIGHNRMHIHLVDAFEEERSK